MLVIIIQYMYFYTHTYVNMYVRMHACLCLCTVYTCTSEKMNIYDIHILKHINVCMLGVCVHFIRAKFGEHYVYVYLIDLTKDMDIYKKIWQKFVFMLFTHAYNHTPIYAFKYIKWERGSRSYCAQAGIYINFCVRASVRACMCVFPWFTVWM